MRWSQVSWVRSRDLQILSHAGVVFTADTRVSATSSAEGAGASRHSLRIERLRASDAGRYECQVNTEPKMSLFFNLTVVGQSANSRLEGDNPHGLESASRNIRWNHRYIQR